MKRCPECGYRVKQDLRDCPLCGVRMRNDPGGQTVKMGTHVHEARGEECLLPNPGEGDAAKARYRAVMEKQLRETGEKSAQLPQNKRRTEAGSKKYVGVLVVLAVYVLMKACGA